ncbi:MAG: NAD-dependent epimerase/dehydratase family protein [Lysobacterales bacterium]
MPAHESPILVTGAAGFIGAHVCAALLARGERVIGLDNFNDYYDPQLKRDRVAALCPALAIEAVDIADAAALTQVFATHQPSRVLHLAAQAGVRYSLEAPAVYVQSNLVGFANVLEACRQAATAHLVYASSSSVYGGGALPPFSEDQRIDRPLSLYAATKVANEAMAHAYAHLYRLALTGLRFFTVYGPWGRPDMAPILFVRAALAGRPIEVFNQGAMRRDFTWIGDIVAGVLAALDRPPTDDGSAAPQRVFNLGNSKPVALLHFIDTIEAAVGRPLARILKPMQPGDMAETMADTRAAEQALGFRPHTGIEQGLPQLVDWCRGYYAGRA